MRRNIMKKEFKQWDYLSDEALINFEKSLQTKNSKLRKRLLEFEKNIAKGKKYSRKDLNWNAIHFTFIYAQLKQEPELKKLNTDKVVREYRKERWEKALKLAKGDEMKAYQISESEDFY